MSIDQKNIEPLVSEAVAEQTPDVAPSPSNPITSRMRSFFSKLVRWLVLILAILAGAVWFGLYSARQVPDFYAEVLNTDLENAHEDGQEFERNLVKLQNSAIHRRPWMVEITQDQVNGWFETDLKNKFPDAIPVNIEDPRAVFTEDKIRLAFKYSVKGVTGIVVVSAEVFCTDNPNEIAVKMNEVKTGFIPLPVGPWLEKVANSIRNAGIPVFWSNDSETPLAIFSLPEHITANQTRRVEVQAVDLQPGRLVIAGKSIRQTEAKQNDKAPKKTKPSSNSQSNETENASRPSPEN